MASTTTRIATGLLAGAAIGASKYMQSEAEQRFQMKMEDLRNRNRSTEREEDRQFQREMEGERQFSTLAADTRREKADERRDAAREASADRRLDKQLGADTQKAADDRAAAEARTQATQGQMVERSDGSLVWAFPDGTTKPVMDGEQPLRGKPLKPGAESKPSRGLTTEERNLVKQTEEAVGIAEFTRGAKLTELQGEVAKRLQSAGYNELAQKYAALTTPTPAKKAEPDTAVAAEPPKSAPKSAPKSDVATAPKPEALAGEGTADKPFTATTQADIDWFKKNAPPGAVIIVNGTKYTK